MSLRLHLHINVKQDPTLGPTGQEPLADGDAIIAALNELQVQNIASPKLGIHGKRVSDNFIRM